jgi:hypothetical protein
MIKPQYSFKPKTSSEQGPNSVQLVLQGWERPGDCRIKDWS